MQAAATTELAVAPGPKLETVLSFNVKQGGEKTWQGRSGVPEVRNSEGDNDGILLRIMDPHRQGLEVFILRFISIVSIMILFTLLTFGPVYFPINKMYFGWSILTGFACACALITVVSTSRFICKRRQQVIGKGMVRWFSWLAILDLIHTHLKPGHKGDLRVTVFHEKKIGFHDEVKASAKKRKSQQSGEKEAYYFDFLADTGDGFDPIYAVFSSLAKSEVVVHNDFASPGQPNKFTLPRSDSVFVGGDICYPLPRHEMIMSRFIRPISWAFPIPGQVDPVPGEEENLDESDLAPITPSGNSVTVPFAKLNQSAPRLYIMPGNHEYFDGMRNFNELILNREHIGGWRTPANSPYFAVKLPFNWWVFCIDLGSDHYQDMDPSQIAYFTDIVKNMTQTEDRFIVMQHEPDWLKNGAHRFELFKEFQRFRHDVLGVRLRISFAGDLHYYRRMEESKIGTTTVTEKSVENSEGERKFGLSYISDKMQLIVAGFGGAFSHPTNNPKVEKVLLGEPWLPKEEQEEFKEVISYPSPEQSFRNLSTQVFNMFDFKHNAVYGHILGANYLLMFAAVSPLSISSATIPAGDIFPATWPSPAQVAMSPLFLLQTVKSAFFYLGFLWLLIERIIVAFANIPKTPKYKRAGLSLAIIHTLLQFAFAVFCRWVVDIAWSALFYYHFPANSIQDPGSIILYCFLTSVSMYLLAFFLAVHITAIFYFSVSSFIGGGFSYSEAYSPLMEKNYKGFVRLQLDASGNVTLYAVGIEKTPEAWRETDARERTSTSPGVFTPAAGQDIRLFLIEKVTVLRDPGSNQGAAP